MTGATHGDGSKIDAMIAARDHVERIEAALAFAGLSWGQFAKLSGCSRSDLDGKGRARCIALVADYTHVDRGWLETGEIPKLSPMVKPASMTKEDHARLVFVCSVLSFGDQRFCVVVRPTKRGDD